MHWYIHSAQRAEFGALHDEFIEGPFRLILSGNYLEVNIESGNAPELKDRAEALAKKYFDSLERAIHATGSLLTEEQFASLPGFASQNLAITESAGIRLGAEGARKALRDIRHAVTSYGSPLRECYDYMQDAMSAEDRFFPSIYKMVEAMENAFGGEARLIKLLKLKNEIKFLKRTANEGERDERHAPTNRASLRRPSAHERGQARDYARKLLRGFEDLCRAKGLAGQ